MNIIINGNETIVTDEITINSLLIERKVKMPEMVSVELNGEIVDRDLFSEIFLKSGDQVELIYFMGGGLEK
jgi:sulfur carrier protein